MSVVFTLLAVQIVLGGFDNLWHHEIKERLPSRRSARGELALHATRELIYGVVFLGLAWLEWRGVWALVLALALVAELVVTIADFLVEDRTRRLPALERALHTVLAVNVGAILAVLAPVLWGWLAMPSELLPTHHGAWSWVLSAAGVGVAVWGVRNVLAVARLCAPAPWQRDPLRVGTRPEPRTVLVTGATGFIGRHLVHALVGSGERVVVLTRDPERATDCFGPHARVVTDLDAIGDDERIDAIVNLAGAPVVGLPWTRRRRRVLLASRLDTTRVVVRLVARLESKPAVLVSASAVGYYGVRGDEVLTEGSSRGEGFQAALCALWERMARRAERHGVRVVCLRMGLVLGRDGGILPRLVGSMRCGVGVVLGSGRQWAPWIHIHDLVRLVQRAIDDDTLAGPVNAVALGAVRNVDLVDRAARVLRCPLRVRMPAAPIRALGEMSELLLDGQLVVPAVALGGGFRLVYPRVGPALRDLLEPPRGRPWEGRVEIFYNGACPVCSAEIAHYRRVAERERSALILTDVSREPDALAAYGLGWEEVRRRLHARDARGRIRAGIDAFEVLWGALDRYRWLGRAVGWPPLARLAGLVYEGLAAPALTRMNDRHGRAEPVS